MREQIEQRNGIRDCNDTLRREGPGSSVSRIWSFSGPSGQLYGYARCQLPEAPGLLRVHICSSRDLRESIDMFDR